MKKSKLKSFKRTTAINMHVLIQEFRLAVIDRENCIEDLKKEIGHLRTVVVPEYMRQAEELRRENHRLRDIKKHAKQ